MNSPADFFPEIAGLSNKHAISHVEAPISNASAFQVSVYSQRPKRRSGAFMWLVEVSGKGRLSKGRSIDKHPIMESEVIRMSNEEKILEMLAAMQADIVALKRDSATKDDLAAMEKRILEQSTINMQVLLEGLVDPKFNLLADGQKLIQEKMLPMEALDDAEDRLDVLEAVVKTHSREIRELKKAQ